VERESTIVAEFHRLGSGYVLVDEPRIRGSFWDLESRVQ
jgi:hypothetical protein